MARLQSDGGIGKSGAPAAVVVEASGQVRIPVERYTSRSFLATEFDRLWSRTWQMVCRERAVARTGDFVEYRIGHRSFLVVRGVDDRVRAFHNVCPHRGNILRTGCGNAGANLQCSFHMWSFELDGAVRSITDRHTFEIDDDGPYRLQEVAVGAWAGWIFINPDPRPAQPLADHLQPLAELLAPYHLDELVPVEMDVTMMVGANWKTALESFIEVYHVHAIHPQLLPNGDDVNMTYDLWETHSCMVRPYGLPSPRLGPAEHVEIDEILESIFGPPPADRGADPTAADPSVRTDTSGWSAFEPFRDSAGAIVLPEGTSVRDVLLTYYAARSGDKPVDFSELAPDQFIDNRQFMIFPNLVVNVNPTAVLLFRFLPDPDDPHRCTWDVQKFDWVRDAEPPVRRVVDPDRDSLGLLLDQDLRQLVRVQRGLRSGSIAYTTLSSQECRIAHFNRVLDRHLEPAAARR